MIKTRSTPYPQLIACDFIVVPYVDFCTKKVVQRKCVGDQRRITSTCRSKVQGQERVERM